MGTILCIAGYSAAGKGTLSRHLGNELGVPVFSLGDYQRKKFAEHGTPQEYHRKFGLNEVYYELWPEFLVNITKLKSEKGIIIDGLYTYKFLELLRKSFKEDNAYVMHVLTERDARIRFYYARSPMSAQHDVIKELNKLDQIKRDAGLIYVIKSADIVVHNSDGLQEFLRKGTETAKKLFGVV